MLGCYNLYPYAKYSNANINIYTNKKQHQVTFLAIAKGRILHRGVIPTKNQRLAAKLKELRKVYGYRQDDVAAALGCVRQTYSHYETGKRTPDYEALFKLAGLYHVSVDDLMQLAVEIDREECFDAPPPTQSSEDLAGFLEYFNNPHNQKKFQYFGNLEKELIYYFEKLSDVDKRELIEIAKIKTRK